MPDKCNILNISINFNIDLIIVLNSDKVRGYFQQPPHLSFILFSHKHSQNNECFETFLSFTKILSFCLFFCISYFYLLLLFSFFNFLFISCSFLTCYYSFYMKSIFFLHKTFAQYLLCSIALLSVYLSNTIVVSFSLSFCVQVSFCFSASQCFYL